MSQINSYKEIVPANETRLGVQKNPDVEQLKPHPFLEKIPSLSTDERAALAESVRVHGLLVPIHVWQGFILDGRARMAVCHELSIQPRIEEFQGSEEQALDTIWSLNSSRRHLTTAQRAILALDLKAAHKKLAQQRILAGKKANPTQQTAEGGQKGETNEIVGAKVGVSRESIRKVERIIEQAPDLEAALRSGVVSIPEADTATRWKVQTRTRVLDEMRDNSLDIHSAAKKARSEGYNDARTSNQTDEWYTPAATLDAVREVLGKIELDPFSCELANKTVDATQIFTIADDGLKKTWKARTLFTNPPYSLAEQCVNKTIAEYDLCSFREGILLVKGAFWTRWYQPLWNYPVCLTRHTLNFLKLGVKSPGSAIEGTALAYFGENPEKFREVFSKVGRVVMPDEYWQKAPKKTVPQTQRGTAADKKHSCSPSKEERDAAGTLSIEPNTDQAN